MNLRRRKAAALLATAGMLTVSACSAGSTDQDENDGGDGASAASGDLSIGLVAEPANLDFTTTDGAAIPQVLLYNVYENLVQLDQEGTVVPGLAESWETSEDGTVYTFELRDGVTFSNGEEFSAEDAKFSIEAVQNDWSVSLAAAMDIVESVEAVSPTELAVTLKRPSNDWLYRMTTRIGAMFDEKGVANLGTKPIGTGPYTLRKWNRGDSIVLERNDDYWGDAPGFSEVEFKYFADPTALNNAFLTDTIDVIGTVQTPESLGQFEGNDDYQVIEGTTNGEVLLSMNNESGPLSEQPMREAVRYALDNEALLETCWAGRGELIGSMVPPTDPWYEDLTDMFPYDVEQAESLLDEAGYDGKPLRLRVPSLPYAVACGQVVKSQLEQAGIEVDLDQLEFPAAWLQTVFTDADYDMSIISHVEPRDMGAVFGDPSYYTRYDNAEFRDLLEEADQASPEEQVTLMQDAAELLSQDAAGEFLFVLPNLMVAGADITGLPENAISESFDLTSLGRE
ncbi:Nickel-binding periplasmic protein precursor [Nocardioides dokdonensis FR1436]|uniref:Nickel-binding periplasmic protein n=1 Tax=Nocardioides dokdonensis FR1436 TaxID=1300347 RepID=A0A1A9GJL9_9ACTN|nr:ABC transporter substrate-binding protein [Nocardioides dokdonensis]ANH37862.1 Nickel-binding periplasmic protein precursor [Nocardioides dokdonensis FR1436]